jgi:hypothetical protein
MATPKASKLLPKKIEKEKEGVSKRDNCGR